MGDGGSREVATEPVQTRSVAAIDGHAFARGNCDADFDLTAVTEILITNTPGEAFSAEYTGLSLVPYEF